MQNDKDSNPSTTSSDYIKTKKGINVAIAEDNLDLRDRLKKIMDQSLNLNCTLAVESVKNFLRNYNNNSQVDIFASRYRFTRNTRY